ncbi:UNVERIFIED_ORG: hypothetical protein [Escherichia phage CMSTMSU]
MILEEGSGDCVYVVQDRRELESLLDEFNAGGNPKSTQFLRSGIQHHRLL